MELDEGHSYRLQKISEIQEEIEQERNFRAILSKKYHRTVRILQVIDDIMVATAMGLGITGIGILSTIVAAPVVIAMEAASLGVGAVHIIIGQINKKLRLKSVKHDKIKTLAEAKLNTISDLVSKALNDDRISDEEFSLILSELDKFNDLKDAIRSKEEPIDQGGQDTIEMFQNIINRTKNDVERERGT